MEEFNRFHEIPMKIYIYTTNKRSSKGADLNNMSHWISIK